ncbi:MAG: LysR family transcriptional regulator [Verrucomicrobiae bacterium]|nr:LysR family transcriptional regulator [Verrucomicrobiae bacterium]MCX7722158.1 LysR family transcriptional regulator [Verrucomicrobiae bacterium]MDW7979649.1 LysR family transcriptional regulator [Verrucomicrobiales bacterium]
MQIESLKIFCDLAETKSFTRTAEINGVTQSAVSQQISALERHFGARMVERSRKNFRLTAEGQVLYEFSKQIIQTYEGLHAKIQELRDIICGTIRISAIYSIGLHNLPPYIRRFMQAHPTVNVLVEYRGAHQVYSDVLGNAADFGLVAYPQREPQLEVVHVGKEPLVLICHPQHPLARRKQIKLKDMSGMKLVCFEGTSPTGAAIDRLLRARKVKVERAMEFDNVETIKRAVEIDAGVAIVPLSTVTQELEKHTLAVVQLDEKGTERPWGVIYKRNKVLSPAMKSFLELLKKPL